MRLLIAIFAGLLFGVGLAMSSMVDANRVLGFLDVTGNWDPTLMFVLGGAVLTTLMTFRFILKRPKPIDDACFHINPSNVIDKRLIIGSAIFGIGWGLAGYCPGPAIATLPTTAEALWFIPSMAIGMLVARASTKSSTSTSN